MTHMTRRNVFLPDKLWAEIQKAAAAEGHKRGTPMHASEWIRGALTRAAYAPPKRKGT